MRGLCNDRKYFHRFFNPCPQEAAGFFEKWIQSDLWAFCAPQERASYVNDFSFFFSLWK